MRKRLTRSLALAAFASALWLSFGLAYAEGWTDKVNLSGYVTSDLRYQLEKTRGAKPGQGYEFEANRNDVDLRLDIFPTDRIRAVVDTRLRFWGFNQASTLPETIKRSKIDPYEFNLDEAYLHIKGFISSKLDLKMGRMVQTWGTADGFNPTDNLNARDLSDPLNATAKVPNQMVELDAYPTDWWTLKFVWVPLFKPSQLPDSSQLAFYVRQYKDANGDDKVDFPPPPMPKGYTKDLMDVFTDGNAFIDVTGGDWPLHMFDATVRTIKPSNHIKNSQFAIKSGFQIQQIGLDFSLSYYYGRSTFPVAVDAGIDVMTYMPGETPTPRFTSLNDPRLKAGYANVNYIAEIMYPKMQVVGFDFSHSASWFYNVGFVGEVALIIPQPVNFGVQGYLNGEELCSLHITKDNRDIPICTDQNKLPTGVKAPNTVNVPNRPFAKATFGMDYTFTSWLYVNTMYVYGFTDEFNDRYGLHHYWVAATKLSFLDQELQFQIASTLDCNDLSAILYPQVTWVVVPGAELSAGAFYIFGDTHAKDSNVDYSKRSKFGQKATGRSMAFMRGKVTF